MTLTLSRHPSHYPTIFTLPSGDGVIGVADACRSALLSFLNGISLEGWTRQELAEWLRGPYEAVTQLGAELAGQPGRSIAPPLVIDEASAERVMAQTHRECVNLLRAMVDPEQGTSLVFQHVRSGVVMRCEDAQGRAGWLPIAGPRMRLAERLQSLIAVDFLTRPEDYEGLLALCGRCGAVEFDAMSRARGQCRLHVDSTTFARAASSVPQEALGPEGAEPVAS